MAKEEKKVLTLIENKFRATWDGGYNWLLEEYTDVYGVKEDKNKIVRQDWVFRGYYPTVYGLCVGITKKWLAPSILKEDMTLQTMYDEILHYKKKLEEVIEFEKK